METGKRTMYAFVSARERSREAGKTLKVIQEVLCILPGEHSTAYILKVVRVVLEGQQDVGFLTFGL